MLFVYGAVGLIHLINSFFVKKDKKVLDAEVEAEKNHAWLETYFKF